MKLLARNASKPSKTSIGPDMTGVVPGSDEEKQLYQAFKAERAAQTPEVHPAVVEKLGERAAAGQVVITPGERHEIVNQVTGEMPAITVEDQSAATQDVPVRHDA